MSSTIQSYKNYSKAIDPPACTPGSAQGLTYLKIKDRRASRGTVEVSVKIKNAFITAPVGPLRATLVFGASATESAYGECASTNATGAIPCAFTPSGTTMRCR